MKLFIFLLSVCALWACEKTSIDDQQPETGNKTETDIPEGYVRLALKTDNNRTLLVDDGVVIWSEGDKVSVNNATYKITIEDGNVCVYVPEADSYSVMYPAEIRSTKKLMFLQPQQLYVENSFGEKALPLYGEGNVRDGVTMRAVCGVLKLTLTGDATISSIGVTDRAGGAMCGVFTYTNGNAEVESGYISHPSVVLNCEKAGGVKLNSSGVDFYIVLPARTYSSGLKISISDTSGRAQVIDSATPRTIKAHDILKTPTIAYAPDADLVFAEYFDKNVWGSDRQAERVGFGNPAGANATGYELSTSQTDATAYGTEALSTTWDSPQKNLMTESYLKSRALDNWQMLFQCREIYGALAVGHSTNHRGILRFPKLTNIGEGEICMAQLSFKVAFKHGSSCDPLLVRFVLEEGPGCVLAYYLDGKKISTPKSGSYWTSSSNTMPIPGLAVGNFSEHFVINNTTNKEIKDVKWHTIRLDLGAITNDTVIMLQSYSAHSEFSEFFIDDIEIRKVPYPYQDDAERFSINTGTVSDTKKLLYTPSSTVSINSGTWMNSLPQLKSLGAEYVDLSVGWEFFYSPTGNNGDTAKWDEYFRTVKAKLDAVGLKVWHIHLPGVGTTFTQKSDGTWTSTTNSDLVDFANYDATIRTTAVEKMSDIISHISILGAKYLLVHPSGWYDGGPEDNYYYTSLRKAALVASLKSLVAAAEKVGATMVLENLGNYKSPKESLTIMPEYINYFTTQVPGLKFCFDFSHSTVDNINDGAQFIRDLNPGILTALHVHGGGNDRDVHLFPGYTGMYKYKDNLNWGEIYEELVKYGYRGPFTYEPSSYAVDCNASWSTIFHNFYNYVYPEYRKRMGN